MSRKDVEVKLCTEPCFFTVLWANGSSEVIRAKFGESFHTAFVRKFGELAIETVLEFATGARLNDFKFDNEKKVWVEIGDSRITSVISKLSSTLPYPVAL